VRRAFPLRDTWRLSVEVLRAMSWDALPASGRSRCTRKRLARRGTILRGKRSRIARERSRRAAGESLRAP
jgi:hypothetical protein